MTAVSHEPGRLHERRNQADIYRVLILQIVSGLIAWLFAGFGVAMLFKTRILSFQLPEGSAREAVPVSSRARSVRAAR